MQIIDYILISISIITNVIVWYWQTQNIKALRSVNEIKNLDELKKWYSLMIENKELEHSASWKQASEKLLETIAVYDKLKENMNKAIDILNQDIEKSQDEKAKNI